MSHLPSLDQGKEMVNNIRSSVSGTDKHTIASTPSRQSSKHTWFEDLSGAELQAASLAHHNTFKTIQGAHKQKWSIVPSLTSGIDHPVDVTTLSGLSNEMKQNPKSFLPNLISERLKKS